MSGNLDRQEGIDPIFDPPESGDDQDTWSNIGRRVDNPPQALGLKEGEVCTREQELLFLWKMMCETRAANDLEYAMTAVGVGEGDRRSHFFLSTKGLEAAQVMLGRYMRKGDVIANYYRARGEIAASGALSWEVMAENVFALARSMGAGRQMPAHFLTSMDEQHPLGEQVNILSISSSIGAQVPHALGGVLAQDILRHDGRIRELFPHLEIPKDAVTVMVMGDSAGAEGITLESLQRMAIYGLPIVVVVLNNGIGISEPGTNQVMGGSLSRALAGYVPRNGETNGIKIMPPVNGWDITALETTMKEAFATARARANGQQTSTGAVLVEITVPQPDPHSIASTATFKDDARRVFDQNPQHDPMITVRQYLENLVNPEELNRIEQEAKLRVKSAYEKTWENYYQPIIDLARATVNVLEQHLVLLIPADKSMVEKMLAKLKEGSTLDARGEKVLERKYIMACIREILDTLWLNNEYDKSVNPLIQALGTLGNTLEFQSLEAYSSEVMSSVVEGEGMAQTVKAQYEHNAPIDFASHLVSAVVGNRIIHDPRYVAIGPDLKNLGDVGGLAKIGGRRQVQKTNPDKPYEGFAALARYIPEEGVDPHRILSWGIAENSQTSAAGAMAMMGLRPINFLPYVDYAGFWYEAINNGQATVRHRTAGAQKVPAITFTTGNRLQGYYHAGSHAANFMLINGLWVGVPNTIEDACGLFNNAADFTEDPVLIMLSLLATKVKVPVPSNLQNMRTAWGIPKMLQQHDDPFVTIVTYGNPSCDIALSASTQLAKRGLHADVVDLVTLSPLDIAGIVARSVTKSTRLVVVGEDTYPGAANSIFAELAVNRLDVTTRRPLLHSLADAAIISSPPHEAPYGVDALSWSKTQPHHIVDQVLAMDGGHSTRPLERPEHYAHRVMRGIDGVSRGAYPPNSQLFPVRLKE